MQEMRPEFVLLLQMQQENELQAGQQIWWLPWDTWPSGCQSVGNVTRGQSPSPSPPCVPWWVKAAKWGLLPYSGIGFIFTQVTPQELGPELLLGNRQQPLLHVTSAL